MIDRTDAVRKFVLRSLNASGISSLARPLVGGIGAILMLHRVTAFPEKPEGVNRGLTISPAFLGSLILDMKEKGYVFVSMDEAAERMQAGTRAGEPFATITADDGYRDNLIEALPVLEDHDVPVTVYIAPGLIDGKADLWWELIEDVVLVLDEVVLPEPLGGRRLAAVTTEEKAAAISVLKSLIEEELPETGREPFVRALARAAGIDAQALNRRMLMNWEEVRRLAAHPLATIGSHTIHHYNLRRLSPETLRTELAGAADALERRLGARPRHMAYPYGFAAAVGPREAAAAREAGFATAVTTRHGILRAGHARHLTALPRISVNGRFQNLDYLRALLSGVTTPLANAGRLTVTV